MVKEIRPPAKKIRTSSDAGRFPQITKELLTEWDPMNPKTNEIVLSD